MMACYFFCVITSPHNDESWKVGSKLWLANVKHARHLCVAVHVLC